jgi:hypothetical protein
MKKKCICSVILFAPSKFPYLATLIRFTPYCSRALVHSKLSFAISSRIPNQPCPSHTLNIVMQSELPVPVEVASYLPSVLTLELAYCGNRQTA